MMALFANKGRDLEAGTCTFIFIISIFYIVLSYKNVNDNSNFIGSEQKLPMGGPFGDEPEL